MKCTTTLIVAISAFSLCLLTGKSLSAQERPNWCNNCSKQFNNSYIRVYSESGYDEDQLRDKIIERIVKERGLTGEHANISSQHKNIEISYNNELYLKARIVDEYVEHPKNAQYPITVWQLVQIAKNPSYELENVYVSNEYPFSARVFVPGMAQIYKGSKNKGIAFIATETAFIGGIVTAECLRASYKSKVNSTHNTVLKKEYIQNANTCSIVRNIAIAGAAAVYVWNVIDGIAAKGKQTVFLSNAQMQLFPYATCNGGGIVMNINF